MNLADAFLVLAQSGCQLRADADGGIVVDVPHGCPPVPSSVLDVLAAHREQLCAALVPSRSEPESPAAAPRKPASLSHARYWPYAAKNLAVKSPPQQEATSLLCGLPDDSTTILARAKARAKAGAPGDTVT
jgi:hypothetical protein